MVDSATFLDMYVLLVFTINHGTLGILCAKNPLVAFMNICILKAHIKPSNSLCVALEI